MQAKHAILVEMLDLDLSSPDDSLISKAEALAISATEGFVDHAFDYREVLTKPASRRMGLPGGVVLGRRHGQLLQRLLDKWATKPWRQIMAWFRDAKVSSVAVNKQFLKAAWDGAMPENQVWPLAKALELVAGDYTFEGCFFSAPDGSSRLSENTRNRVRTNPERFALVFFECHVDPR